MVVMLLEIFGFGVVIVGEMKCIEVVVFVKES